MEAICCGVPAPFLPNASVSAVTASHPFGGGNAGGKMDVASLPKVMAGTAGVLLNFVSGQPDGIPESRKALRDGAQVIMQMWGILDEMEARQKALA